MSKLLVVFLLTILTSTFLNGSLLHDKVKNIIGSRDYQMHKSLIGLLFKNESNFVSHEKIKYNKVFKKLQENGLLNLRLDRPSQIEIEFIGLSKTFKAYKILNDTMQILGYRYFFTKSMSIDQQKNLIWNIVLKVEYILDPVMLIKELRANRCRVTEVKNLGSNKWSYTVDFENAELTNAVKIDKNEKFKFQKPLRPYMLKVTDAKNLQVISRNLNHWLPHIVFFDKDLKVLKVIKKNRIFKGLKVKIPENTRYIKITDMYNLINIKRGLSIIVR